LFGALIGIQMGFATTILITLISLVATLKLENFLGRVSVVFIATYIGACLSYWVPFWLVASDQAVSWQWLVINLYFIAGSVYGVIGSILILISYVIFDF